MLIVVFLVVMLCGLVGGYQRSFRLEDKDDMFLQNIGNHLQDHMMLQSRRPFDK
jgi:hypothetical protein